MVEKSPNSIKNTFVQSAIFETIEEVTTNPFVFQTTDLQQRGPQDIPNVLLTGDLLIKHVSTSLAVQLALSTINWTGKLNPLMEL